ncbi:FAD linked oxidase domain protein [Xylanimonas cellulosilytica DSM 15894]|uniref:FAD linked oxidase domain protein n=1 Tax=Xylanimonas cellulosilytica (strain DSM 15894 / JCM 12276 / CECT 5975 / KCTC 9989 / LMG 20990 / NBRC 107835 / XIL07) TaxID=446471 RepID=D1BVE4_XYLCX|nr:LLM class flavin-dependent oxidoreductase [Xylanimonas cellulosilytica]ACZ29415.1 FAD linked oxidase domain protein [Xylanimonas cellulosilytica DSM 15894]
MTDYGHDLAFGSFITPTHQDPQQPVRLARLSEDVGLDLVTFQDHPYQPAFHDTWTLLTWVAAATERVTVSGNVLNLPLRPPAVLARAVASLDLLSGGRAALGIGAGGFWDPIVAMGGTRLSPGESVDALGEALDVIRELWDTTDRRAVRVEGEHHRVVGAKRGPAPAHDVPIWVGAYKPRMLRLVAEKADGWLPSAPYLKDGDLARGNAVIDEAAVAAGRDPAEIRRLLNLGAPGGSTEQWIDELVRLAVEDGIGTFIAMGDDPDVIRRFGSEVAPAVREAVAAERASRGTVPAASRRGAAAVALRREGIAYDDVPRSLQARAVEPGDKAYAGLRHNYLRSGAPGLVLRPRDAEEVADAITFARTQVGASHGGVELGVRSGGHGISGRSTNDGGIVVDLGALDGIEVLDEATRRVRVGAGATWGEVAAALQPHGWAITSGDYGGVGVGGLATTAGIGLLGRSQGLTIDHVVAADVVTADGRLVRASADENPELFWGLRGAGANLGAVTSFELEAGALGDVVYSQMTLDAADTAGLLERWGAVVESAPRELTSFLILSPPRRGQQPVAQLMTVWAGEDTDAAITQLEALADSGPLLAHQAYLLPYTGVVQPAERHHAGGGDPAVRSTLVTHLTDDVTRAFEKVAWSGEAYFLQVRATGGAAHDVAPDATAYAHRHQNFLLTAMGASQPWLDPLWDELMGPHADGLYLSFDTDTRAERLADAFPGRTLDRLRALKAQWDPSCVFRSNFPIPPLGA